MPITVVPPLRRGAQPASISASSAIGGAATTTKVSGPDTHVRDAVPGARRDNERVALAELVVGLVDVDHGRPVEDHIELFLLAVEMSRHRSFGQREDVGPHLLSPSLSPIRWTLSFSDRFSVGTA